MGSSSERVRTRPPASPATIRRASASAQQPELSDAERERMVDALSAGRSSTSASKGRGYLAGPIEGLCRSTRCRLIRCRAAWRVAFGYCYFRAASSACFCWAARRRLRGACWTSWSASSSIVQSLGGS